MTTTTEPRKPSCPCCGGNGLHYWQVSAAGKSPADSDIECSLCAGTGESWFEARANSCTAYRTLRARYR